MVDNNVRKLRVPIKGGQWDGTPGNSRWYPEDSALYFVGHEKYLTGKDLKKKYHFTTITYHNSEPDFFPFADQLIGPLCLNVRPVNRNRSYSIASNMVVDNGSFNNVVQVNEYMRSKDLVWHECGDGFTIIAIPAEINHAFVHTGGIGINKGLLRFKVKFKNRNKMILIRSTCGRRIRSLPRKTRSR